MKTINTLLLLILCACSTTTSRDERRREELAEYAGDLRNPDPERRRAAVLALEDNPRAVFDLAQLLVELDFDLTSDVEADTVASILDAIRSHGPGTSSKARLGRALFGYAERLAWVPESPHQILQMQHIHIPDALAKILLAPEDMRAAAASPHWQVRHVAALAAGRQQGEMASVLADLWDDAHPEVRCAARRGTPAPVSSFRAYRPCEGADVSSAARRE